MYSIVNGLQGGLHMPQPRFRYRRQKDKEKPPSRPCCQVFAEKLRTFFLRLRAAILILLSTLGVPAFYLTFHFLLSPGLATLGAHLQPATCIVVSSSVKRGQMNCTWSSCRQGCTKLEIYTCWQVLVLPHQGELNHTDDLMINDTSTSYWNFDSVTPETGAAISASEFGFRLDRNRTALALETDPKDSSFVSQKIIPINKTHHDSYKENPKPNAGEVVFTSFLPSSFNETDLAKLKINVAGCDYTPCDDWWQKYSRIGTAFSCYVGDDGQLAVPEFDVERTAMQVSVGVLPLILAILSSCLIYRLYCRKGHSDNTLSLSQRRSAKKAKMDEIRAKLIMERNRKDKEPGKPKIENIWTFALKSKQMAKVRPADGTDQTLEIASVWGDAENNNYPNCSSKVNALDQWRKMAGMALQHPAASSARLFNEVEINFIDRRGFNQGASHHQSEASLRLSWSDEYLVQVIEDEEEC
ncbi:protein tipE-like [Macrobrachium nipponense]|uniref:protein tipE-like n=1 Tax=Macrobrachium nipponense TaxID=159736 RepID=UPI0030C89659